MIHEQIFSLSYHSQGAFTQDIAYKVPVFLRIFYLNKLIEFKEKEKEAMEKGSNSSNRSGSSPKNPRGK